MTIAVAYKWAGNPQDAVVDASGAVDWSRAKASVGEYDAVAIELGRRLADATGQRLVGVSVGGPEVDASLARKAGLSRGLDELVVVLDPAATDTASVAAALAEALATIDDVQVVLTGESSTDVAAKLTGPVLAGRLGWPAVLDVRAVDLAADHLRVVTAVPGGTRTLAVTGPAVLAVASDAVTARVSTMKDILAAAKKPVRVHESPAHPAFAVVGRARPAQRMRKHQVIDASDPQAGADELVAALRADGVL
jgi:electron transfer flavoprotein beta subunit